MMQAFKKLLDKTFEEFTFEEFAAGQHSVIAHAHIFVKKVPPSRTHMVACCIRLTLLAGAMCLQSLDPNFPESTESIFSTSTHSLSRQLAAIQR